VLRNLTALAALLPSLAAQEPPTPQDLARLADAVDAVHRPDGKGRPVVAFRSALALELVAADASERGQVELKVQFLAWRPPDRDRARPLIRYEMVDASKPVVRGRDRHGYWLFDGREVHDLQGREGQDDLDAVRRDLRLAQQLVRLLDPGAVLRSLRRPGPVAEEALQQGRTEPVPCRTVAGDLETFPLLHGTGEDRPARVKVWVARDSGRLLAAEAWPLDAAGNPLRDQGELIRLDEHRPTDGVLLPMRLTHFLVDPDGRRRVQMKVTLTTIHLNPALAPEDLDRPK
jgi:hypothetical protein